MSSSQPHLGGDEFGLFDFGEFDNFINPLGAIDDGHAYPLSSIDLSLGSPNNFKATRDTTSCTIDQPSGIVREESNAAADIDSQEFTRSLMSPVQAPGRRETTGVPEVSSSQNAVLSSDNSPPSERHRSKLKRRRFSESIWSDKRPAIEKYYQEGGKKFMMRKMRTPDFDPSESAYKDRLRVWGVRKNVPKKAIKQISKMIHIRKHEEGKKSRVRLHGRPVPPTTIHRAGKLVDNSSPLGSRLHSLSISTPSGNSSRSLPVRSQPVDTRDSSSSRRSGNHSVEIHQRDDFRLKSGIESLERAAQLIREIGGQPSLSREQLSDILKPLPKKSLYDLLECSLGRRPDWVVDLIYEHIIMKAGDTGDCERFEHIPKFLNTLLQQQRFWQVEMMAQGLRADRTFMSSPDQYRLSIFKILLLARIGEKMHKPRTWEEMEQGCLDIINGERQFQPNSNRKEPLNLILAYLFRVYGSHHCNLQQNTISKMERLVNDQFHVRPPTISFAWAAQQYARWCIYNGQYNKAMAMLKDLAPQILEIRQSEKISTHVNEYYIQLCRQRLSAADEQSMRHMAHDGDEMYPIDPIDSDRRLFEAVERYLWQKPLPMDPASRSKHQDLYYYR